MTTITLADIRALGPCYDPAEYLPEDWQGSVLDILNLDEVPAQDRLWVVLTGPWVDDRTKRLFGVWCAREALKLVDNPDPRSVAVCDVAERFANGEATEDELRAARAAAGAAEAAARAAADAAGVAAWAAARAAGAAGAAQIEQLKLMIAK